MNLVDVRDSIISCITKLNFNGGGEKLFEVYQAFSTVSTQDTITRYKKVPDLANCFYQQYTPLSKYVASKCIPKELKTSFFTCMNSTKEQFLDIMKTKRPTLFFNDNTLGKQFDLEIKMCSSRSLAEKVMKTLPKNLESNTTLYVVTSIVVIAITAAILWRISNRQRQQAH